MKTMNKIYRTLLMAVALVMGTTGINAQEWSISFDGRAGDSDISLTLSDEVVTIGNVSMSTASWGTSSEEEVWAGDAGPGFNTIAPTYQDFVNAGADEDKKLRIYATISNENDWGFILQSGWSSSLGFKDWQGQDDGKRIDQRN